MIGKKMTQLSKHPDKEVKAKTQCLIEKWKKIVEREKCKKSPNTEASSNEENSTPIGKQKSDSSGLKNEIHEKSAGIQSKEEEKLVASKDANWNEETQIDVHCMSKKELKEYLDNSNIKDPLRQSIRVSITKALLKIDGKNELKIKVISAIIETGLWKAYGTKPCDYTNKSRTLLANIMRSDEFKKKILDGIFKPEDLATMDPKDMLDDKVRQEKAELEKQIIDSKRSDYMIANMTIKEGMYTWRKCKSKKTTFYEQQTRSADEPMTTFVNWLDWGTNMKF